MQNIYNPEDLKKNKYLIITDIWIYHNDLCTLSLNNYEFMCELNWTNPIYPIAKPERKPNPPRPTTNNKESSYLKDNIYEKIRKRREELKDGDYAEK